MKNRFPEAEINSIQIALRSYLKSAELSAAGPDGNTDKKDARLLRKLTRLTMRYEKQLNRLLNGRSI